MCSKKKAVKEFGLEGREENISSTVSKSKVPSIKATKSKTQRVYGGLITDKLCFGKAGFCVRGGTGSVSGLTVLYGIAMVELY
ncbi:Ankyrin repeat domain-containing protein 36A [Dirofilaria immitis]